MKMFFSPGRVNLIGEHIDYNGGLVLPVCIDIGTYAKVTKRNDSLMVVKSLNFEELGYISFDLKSELKAENNWVDYVKGVVSELKLLFDLDYGFEIEFYGNIPNSSGLSSSASLEVLVCYIFNYYYNLEMNKSEMALLSQRAENNFVGVNCGIMDQFIIAGGVKDQALALNCDTLDVNYIDCNLGDYKLIVLNSNKKRGLVDSEYNTRRLECENALAKFEGVLNLVDLDLEQLTKLEGNEFKRANHVVKENIRVQEAGTCLRTGDVLGLGNLMLQSHYSLKYDYEVSCFELDVLVELAIKNGAIGARMTGAGFGGCAICLVKEDEVKTFIKNTKLQYFELTGLNGELLEVNIVDGVIHVDSVPY